MLDKELRQKLQPLRDDLARGVDPEYDQKTPVHRLAKELNRSIQWVIRKTGDDYEDMHASYRLSPDQESRVREVHRQELTAPEGDPDSPAMTIAKLAQDLMLPRMDVVREVINRGVSKDEATPKLMLYTSEVEVLLEFFGDRWKWRQANPVPYVPRQDGTISFETYERIRSDEREELERAGFLPSRLELSRHPRREWPAISKHFRQTQLRMVPPGPVLNRSVTTLPVETAAHLQAAPLLAFTSTAPKPASPANEAGAPQPPQATKERVLTPKKAGTPPVSTKPVRSTATNTALIPPKPASVAQLQNRQAAGMVKKEMEGGQHIGIPPESTFRAYPTNVSKGSAAVSDLQETLREFHPRMYATFFDQFRAVLEVDRKIARTMQNHEGSYATDPEHARIMDEVCAYSYGMFAYWEMGSKIGRRARRLPTPSAKKVKNALIKLRPMYMGVLTDLCHTRFVFWRAGKTWDLLDVRFDDVHDWLEGLSVGEYVPLTTHHIPLGNNKNLADCAALSHRDQDLVKFMSEAADNLRQGVHGVRGRRAAAGASVSGSQELGGASPSGTRTLGYRPENTWLVPITITDGQVDTTLDEDFFSGFDDKKPHQVRSFYRRPKGSSPNAPRTEFVSGHVRGGRGAFADMKLLPVVTIRRR